MRKFLRGSNDISEVDMWVCELGSGQAVHGSIVSGNLQVSVEHVQ
jgi:hypothetical protein